MPIATKEKSSKTFSTQTLKLSQIGATGFSMSEDTQYVKKTLRMVSLFSGCGGMDLGFEGDFPVFADSVNEDLNPHFIQEKLPYNYIQLKPNRFRTVFANDILHEAKNAWVNYFGKRGHNPDNYHTESVVDLVKSHHKKPVFPENIDILTGGFPCQDFSISGLRNGFNSDKGHDGKLINDPTTETRGELYMWMKRVIETTQPKMFIAENVKGLVNLEGVKDIIQSDFSSIGNNGYIVLKPRVLHAANFGIPQNRERVFFIGIKKSALKKVALKHLLKDEIGGRYDPYPKPTHSFTATGNKLKTPVKLKSLFENLEEPEFSSDLAHKKYSKAKFMGKHCQGQIEIKLEGIAPTIRAEHHGNIEFRRLSKANGGKIDSELNKGLPERRLSPRECGLIQTFPPDYDFVIENKKGRKGSHLVSTSKAYKIIGNAVPPLLAYHIANRIDSLWDLYFKK